MSVNILDDVDIQAVTALWAECQKAAATIQEVKKCRVVWKVSKSIQLEVSHIFALSHIHYFEWNSGVTCLNGKIYLTPSTINHPFHFTNPHLFLIGLTMKDLPNCGKDKPWTVHHRAYTHTHSSANFMCICWPKPSQTRNGTWICVCVWCLTCYLMHLELIFQLANMALLGAPIAENKNQCEKRAGVSFPSCGNTQGRLWLYPTWLHFQELLIINTYQSWENHDILVDKEAHIQTHTLNYRTRQALILSLSRKACKTKCVSSVSVTSLCLQLLLPHLFLSSPSPSVLLYFTSFFPPCFVTLRKIIARGEKYFQI